jgi:cell division inhibitor SulA
MSSHPEPREQPGLVAGQPTTSGVPGRSAAQIRRDVALQREQLSSSVEALRGRVHELTDWRRQMREHKRELVVGAAVVGFAIGGLIALKRRR